MRIVNNMCVSKEKAIRHYVDVNVKVFEEISEILIKDVQKWGLLRSKLAVFVDRGEEVGPKFRLLCGRNK